jgi:hypothetical protein
VASGFDPRPLSVGVEFQEDPYGSYSEKVGKTLLSGVAQATRLAGFLAADTGRDALAQRYYIQALDLAMRAADRRYAAFVLATMSRMTVRIGENTPTEQDTVRHGRQAWPWPEPD